MNKINNLKNMGEVVKRNGHVEQFDINKIVSAVSRAYRSAGVEMTEDFKNSLLQQKPYFETLGSVEKIQDYIEQLLFSLGDQKVYKEFVLYRSKHALLRESENRDTFKSIINTEKNDITRDNANMNSDTPAGMMMKFASETTKPFVDKYLISPDVKKAVLDNILYIHDKDYFPTRSLTCLQHPLDRILSKGFMAGHGEARPAKRIETAAILAAISMETIQNEMHGGQAIPAFDFYMAPYVKMTYKEEVKKLREVFGHMTDNYIKWDVLEEYVPKDYLIETVGDNEDPVSRIKKLAVNNTVKRVHQAMESFIHNMNSIHSRGGNQVVFSSINYGTDTSAEGRCVIRELLLSTEQGVGHSATAIFPIQIWKMKKGASIEPTDPNYDLYKLACKVSARRFFPNFLNLDSTFNFSPEWNADDPNRFENEVATMGCRTRVYENINGPKTSIGRGNLSFSTLNLPKIAIKIAIEDQFLKPEGNTYVFNEENVSDTDKERRLNKFIEKIREYVKLTAVQLDERYQFQKEALAKQFPLLMSGMWNGSDKLKPNDTIESVINQGTLGIGFIGLAEALKALTGKHHGESNFSQEWGLKAIGAMNEEVNELKQIYHHNYAVLGTPAEGLSGRFTVDDRKEFGEIKGVTDREYYTNSSHVPVYYKCTASHKAEIECPYHKLEKGGHIFYVEVDADVTKNPEVIDTINRIAIANDGGYISINHVQGRCRHCNYESNDPNLKIGDVCPVCGQPTWDVLQRITGYLVGTTDRWNNGKSHELADRTTHVDK